MFSRFELLSSYLLFQATTSSTMAVSATTKTIRFLTTSQVLRLHSTLVNGTAMPTQPDLLESAVNGPINAKHYGNQVNLFQLAANLSEKIMKNHAYQDGNKRTALVAADMFLKINGYKLQRAPLQKDEMRESLENAHVAVVTKTWTVEQLGDYYQSAATVIETWTPEIIAYRNEALEY